METKLRQFESQREALTTSESRRIAQLFKRKYEAEVNDLRSKLQKLVSKTRNNEKFTKN